jgi:exopolyphosphatase
MGANEADLAGSRLAGFLQSQKELFFGDLESGKGKGWTVAVGNEAGGKLFLLDPKASEADPIDLDSLVSSIALAYLSSTLAATRTVPLFMTPKSLMHLRPENILALKHANIPTEVLIHPETLPAGLTTSDLTKQGVHFALVDMNRLLPGFGAGKVDLIIDHHEDEGVHEDAERLIQVPTGSCASLVTKYFKSQWTAATSSPAGAAGSPVPPELATLLLSAMVIDTAGLKTGGKAVDTDYESASFLYPLSTFATSSAGTMSISSTSPAPQALSDFSNQLLEQKFDVSDLTTHDLLLRDYKEYILPTSSTSFPSLQVGLSTVPMSIKKSLEKESEGWTSYMKALDGYMHEKNLDIEGVLTTYKTDKKGKHKRELLILVRSGGSIKTSEEARRVRDELIEGLEAGEVLELEVWGEKKSLKLNKKAKEGEELLDSGLGGRWGKVWVQGNDKATRKQVAPLLVSYFRSLAWTMLMRNSGMWSPSFNRSNECI